MLNHIDKGQGNPALVFIHGMTGSMKSWRAQLDTDWPGHRCVAIDLPGHGKSGPLPGLTSIATVAAALNAQLERLGLDDVVLIAHSLGCRITTEMWSQSPGRIRAMVFVDGSLSDGDPEANLQRWEKFIRETEELAESKGRDPKTARAFWQDFVRWDANRSDAAVRSINVPVLALQATALDADRRRRRLQPGETTSWTRLLAQTAAGDLTYELIPDSGHNIMLDAAERTNALIKAFLRRC